MKEAGGEIENATSEIQDLVFLYWKVSGRQRIFVGI